MEGAMPTVLLSGPYRFYFYSHETNEPPHIHVDRDTQSAKFWLDSASLARNGFSPKELRRIQKIVLQHRVAFLEAWNGHLGA
jgi:hypothetical protein